MSFFEASEDGTDEAIEFTDSISAAIPDAIQIFLKEEMEDFCSEARNNLQNNTSVKSAALNESIKILAEEFHEGEAGSDLDYASYVEFGRGPVKPITKKALHWVDADTGDDVFAKSVGPAQPRPFLEPARITIESRYQDNEARIDVVITQLVGKDKQD